MKKIFTAITLVVFLIFCCLPLTGCRYLYWKLSDKEADGFIYELDKDDNAIIKGLTDAEKEVDTLVIPKELDGFPVTALGVTKSYIGADDSHYGINGYNVKRIVINHELDYNKNAAIQNFTGELVINTNSLRGFDYLYDTHCEGFAPKRVVINSNDEAFCAKFGSYVRSAASAEYCAVKFYSEKGSELIFYQAVQLGGTAVEPDIPLKESDSYNGWYLEDGTKLDFYAPVTKDITLYAKLTDI